MFIISVQTQIARMKHSSLDEFRSRRYVRMPSETIGRESDFGSVFYASLSILQDLDLVFFDIGCFNKA
jgi:hypothetical protein